MADPLPVQPVLDVEGLTHDELLTGWAMEIVAMTYQGTSRATLANIKEHAPFVRDVLVTGDFTKLQ